MIGAPWPQKPDEVYSSDCRRPARGAILNRMVYSRLGPLDRTFAALADPTRRTLVAELTRGPRTVGELAAPLPMSLVAVGKHLVVLERAGLVDRTRDGRTVVCSLRAQGLRDAARWLDAYHRFWTDRIDSLHRHLGGTP
jgi:DNA-binding transcriptional ArsR family regulator